MKRKLLLECVLVMVFMTYAPSYSQYYYGGGNQIPLRIDSSKVLIQPAQWAGANDIAFFVASIGRIESTVEDDHTIDQFLVCSLSTGINYDSFLDSLESTDEVALAEPYYLSSNDSAFLVGTQFCVAFDESISRSTIDSINSANNVLVDHELQYMPNVFVLRNTGASGHRLLNIANLYYSIPAVRYSHPVPGVWIQKNQYKLYDYYHLKQPHTKKVIGAFNNASVWDFAGLDDTIVVAVIDDGVTSHEDLPSARILPGYDFAHNDPDPSPGDAVAHGMGTAGIIAASHTTDSLLGQSSSSGMISMNPNIKILPVKIFNDDGSGAGVSVSSIADAISYAYLQGADVLSNSWGYPFTDPPLHGGFDVLDDALERATLFGRNGLGCPVVFSSGNLNEFFPGIAYPASLSYCFSVGATNLDDFRWNYSSFGEGLDIVAPSGNYCLQGDVWTLDQMGDMGYNPFLTTVCGTIVNWFCGNKWPEDDYDCNFGGTSAAAPIVSGTASLILAKQPNLTSSAVYYILRNSAVTKLDRDTLWYVPSPDRGYGRVDAFRAILSISRGDVDNDGISGDIADLTYLIRYLFIPPNTLPFPDVLLGDWDCNGDVDIGDLTLMIGWLFIGGQPPVNPCFEFGD